MSRQTDAIQISDGACNPIAVAGTISKHMSQMLHDGEHMGAIRTDPALRLMVHQLAFLMNTSAVDDISVFDDLRQKCGAIE